MFAPEKVDGRAELLAAAKREREERALVRKKESAAVKIEALVRGFIARRRIRRQIREEFDLVFSKFTELEATTPLPNSKIVKWQLLLIRHFFPSDVEALKILRRMLCVFSNQMDRERHLSMCRYLLISMDHQDLALNFTALAVRQEHLAVWFSCVDRILFKCFPLMESLRLELPAEAKMVNLYLHTLVSYTSCAKWQVLKSKQADPFKPVFNQICSNLLSSLTKKGMFGGLQVTLKKGLCKKQPVLKQPGLSAVVSLALRTLVAADFNEKTLSLFTVHILTTPGLVYHLSMLSQECISLFTTHKLMWRVVDLLASDKVYRELVDGQMDGTETLCLLANIINLGQIEKGVLVENLLDFTNVTTRMLEKCKSSVVTKKSNVTSWHPVLGWFAQKLDASLNEAMPTVIRQLQYLWSAEMVKCLFSDLVNLIPEKSAGSDDSCSAGAESSGSQELAASVKSLFKKVVAHRSNLKTVKRLGTPETTILSLVCSLYQNAIFTLNQLRYEILSGLCYQHFLLPKLWNFISTLSPQSGLKAFLELLAVNPKATSPEFHILMLFCDCATYLLTILDDVEMYEQQKPFSIELLISMGQFMNQFIYHSVWDSLLDVKTATCSQLFQSVHSYLMLLYNRDSRRTFVQNPNFWLIKDLKPSVFLMELEKRNPRAEYLLSKVPHVIPHKERVILFRKQINADKESLGLSTDHHHHQPARLSTLITVHRGRIVEDGYRQLSLLPVNSLKGVIRVKFINEQGLDEPGIDQDGVFKEFLEETIKKVFDPSLSLFKETSDGRMYPCSTSSIHENHLDLFDFVGKMLGKAVYEGMVTEVPFATFFLNNLLGRCSGIAYSSVDELPSLDAELYKNLTFIKHYEGDVADLDLTFSVDEDYMGSMITHELIDGGRLIGVTNGNKISYIHHMAHFRMNTQIRDQLKYFSRGFRSIIRPEWLNLFSAPELQKLISGDTADIDLEDLKNHVQYYGGFHGNHKVICWLWDILKNDFTADERRLFLKFVTSCSKPPLLGFAYLEPPFSIRCVEVADDQDTGDTLGSVIRGFLALKKRDPVGRLPTSSTCFNLLKLPCYLRKSTLREKLRYAIHSGTGFELS